MEPLYSWRPGNNYKYDNLKSMNEYLIETEDGQVWLLAKTLTKAER